MRRSPTSPPSWWDALADDRPLAEGQTDETGAFRLVVTRIAAARREHPFGPVRVVVRSHGFARSQRIAVAGEESVRFALVKPAVWAGVVNSQAGEPLPGAPVIARQGGMRFATTTDEQGRFAFDEIGPGKTLITADATGYRAATIEKGRLAFALAPLPMLKGQVLDAATRMPLVGVHLVALAGDVEAESDSEGRFALEMEGGRGALAAYLEGYAVGRYEFDGGAISLRPADSVSGTVVNEKDEPVAFAQVRLDPGFGAARIARTNEAGAFEFPIGVSGFAFVHVARRGYLPARATVDASWRVDRVRIRLRKGLAFESQVRAGSNAVLGAEVSLYRRMPRDRRALVARAYSDPSGRVVLDGLPPNADLVVARAAGTSSGEQLFEPKMTLRLVKKPPIRGVVHDDAGKPVAGLSIRVEPLHAPASVTDERGSYEIPGLAPRAYVLSVEANDRFLEFRRDVEPGSRLDFTVERMRGTHRLGIAISPERAHPTRVELRGADWRRVRWVEPSGRLAVFEGLPAGTFQVVAAAPGFQDTTAEVVVAADKQSITQSVVLSRAGTIRLKATAGATVVIQTLQGEPAPAVSLALAGGSGELAGFGPGRYRFLSRAPGEIIVVEEIDVGEKDPPRDLDLSGGPASTLKITVTDSARNPVRGVSIDLLTEGGLRFPTGVMTDDKGVATLARLIRGRLVIVAQKGDLRSEKAIAIGSGAAYEAALVLE
ncbi:MAG: carboxypeptidase regulatory-like domain-containing protein [Planctomycetota bacterium]|jgi:hypothetical protein